jgi:hypothetical protein
MHHHARELDETNEYVADHTAAVVDGAPVVEHRECLLQPGLGEHLGQLVLARGHLQLLPLHGARRGRLVGGRVGAEPRARVVGAAAGLADLPLAFFLFGRGGGAEEIRDELHGGYVRYTAAFGLATFRGYACRRQRPQ